MKEKLIKILKGALIAGTATTITVAAPQLMELSYAFTLRGTEYDMTAFVVGGLSVLINIAKVLLKK